MSQQEHFPRLQASVGEGYLDALPKGQVTFVSEEDFMYLEEGEAFSVFVLIEPDNWQGGDQYGAD